LLALTGLAGGAEDELGDEVLGGVAVGVLGGERLHLIDHLLVGEVLVEPVGGQHEELVVRADTVVVQRRGAGDARTRAHVLDLEHFQQPVVPLWLPHKQSRQNMRTDISENFSDGRGQLGNRPYRINRSARYIVCSRVNRAVPL
jgi:hypothetical protein